MARELVSACVLRDGAPIDGSPFKARIFHVTSFTGRSAEIAPQATKVRTTRSASFQDISAPVALGDMVKLPDGTLNRIIDPRRYSRSLQCTLQLLPFVDLTLWNPTSPLKRLDPAGTLNVRDVSFEKGDDLQGYLDPAPDAVKAAIFGRLDLRGAYAYTSVALKLGAILIDPDGEGWIAETASDVWPSTGDIRALVRHLTALPAGVS